MITQEEIKQLEKKLGIKLDKFDQEQKTMIFLGVEADGLTVEQALIFAKPEYDMQKMMIVRLAFGWGFSNEQVKELAKANFTEKQKEQIWLGFRNDLKKEQILEYAKPEITADEMMIIREYYEIKNKREENK